VSCFFWTRTSHRSGATGAADAGRRGRDQFVQDSSLEGAGFELSVPRQRRPLHLVLIGPPAIIFRAHRNMALELIIICGPGTGSALFRSETRRRERTGSECRDHWSGHDVFLDATNSWDSFRRDPQRLPLFARLIDNVLRPDLSPFLTAETGEETGADRAVVALTGLLWRTLSTRRPLIGSAQPAAPLPRAPSPRAYWRSSEPAGTHARSDLVPSAAALPPPVHCEKSRPASSPPKKWCAPLTTLPHLETTGSRYNSSAAKRLDRPVDDPASHVWRRDLDHRDLSARFLVTVFVHHPSGLEG
jgi:hypothetical protein